LTKISNYLQQNKIPLKLVYESRNDVYAQKNYFFFRDNNTVYLTIKLPLTHFRGPLMLYKSIVVPLQVPNQQHVTKLTAVPAVVAWGRDEDYYIEFDAIPPLKESGLYNLNTGSEALRHRNTPSCITAIMENQLSMINSLCQAVLQPFGTKPSVTVLASSKLFLINIANYTISCHNGSVQQLSAMESKIVWVPCGCTFDSNVAYYLPRQLNCDESNPENTEESNDLGYAVNLPLLMEFFSADQIRQFTNNKLLAEPIRVNLPQLNVFNCTYKTELGVIQ